MMSAMAKWYEGGEKFDQMRLSRILDVAQDLKVGDQRIIVYACMRAVLCIHPLMENLSVLCE